MAELNFLAIARRTGDNGLRITLPLEVRQALDMREGDLLLFKDVEKLKGALV